MGKTVSVRLDGQEFEVLLHVVNVPGEPDGEFRLGRLEANAPGSWRYWPEPMNSLGHGRDALARILEVIDLLNRLPSIEPGELDGAVRAAGGSPAAPVPRVTLQQQTGPTSGDISARIDPNGNLVVSGCDHGEAPRAIFGSDEYEYDLTIPAAERDKLVLALLVELYRGDSRVISSLLELCRSRGIAYKFFPWVSGFD